MSETKYYEFYENNFQGVASDGTPVVVKDRIVKDDGTNPVVSAMLQNFVRQRRCVEVDVAQAESVQATFALGDASHQLREQIRQEERAKLLAEMGNSGMGTSANVNLPNAGQSNAITSEEENAKAADALKQLAGVAAGKK